MGGSIAGLFTTRVLSDHFETVTLVERDCILNQVNDHKGVPQAQHLHVLLAKGLEIAAQLFPDLVNELKAQGATELDFGADVRWYQLGDYKCRLQGGLHVLSQSRPLLEAQVRRHVSALRNVMILSEKTVVGLTTTPDRRGVTGIKLHDQGSPEGHKILEADLLVDAMGRGSQSPRWLELLGYKRPKVSQVKVQLGYTSRIYRRHPNQLGDIKGLLLSPTPPHERRGGAVFPIEDDCWMVTLMGYLGDYAPTDEQGFLKFAQSFPTSDIYNLISEAEALSSPIPHRFPSSLRHHYEQLPSFPEGYLVLGDALCSFNPLFGQGMTVAALEAQELDKCLKGSSSNFRGLAKCFFKRATQVIDTPWQMVTDEDLRYPEVVGHRSMWTAIKNGYISKIYQATHRDPEVYNSLLQVMHLVRSPMVLFSPLMMLRILSH